MRPIQYDSRITIEQPVITKDPDYGTDILTWTAFASRIAANVQDVLPSKSESTQQGIQIALRPARIRARYISGITSQMRVVVHGEVDRTLQIIAGPAMLGRKEGLEFMAQEYSTDPQAS